MLFSQPLNLKVTSMTFREREKELFVRWANAYWERSGVTEDKFAYDGVLFRGECKNIGGCWEMQPGNETQIWINAMCRLLILTKDTTEAGGMDDMRIESARKNHTGTNVTTSGITFYRNLTLWAYALINAMQGGEILTYNDTPTWNELREHYCTAAIARVNCKKQIGSSSISDAELKAHIVKYADFLEEQVKMYDANIILCCGGGGVMIDFIKEHYLPDLERFSDRNWVYFSASTRKIVINSYHPSYLKRSEDMYSSMMEDLKDFIDVHPEFIR